MFYTPADYIKSSSFLSLSPTQVFADTGEESAINYGTFWAVEDAVHLSSLHLLCVSSQWAHNKLLAALHTAIMGH